MDLETKYKVDITTRRHFSYYKGYFSFKWNGISKKVQYIQSCTFFDMVNLVINFLPTKCFFYRVNIAEQKLQARCVNVTQKN